MKPPLTLSNLNKKSSTIIKTLLESKNRPEALGNGGH